MDCKIHLKLFFIPRGSYLFSVILLYNTFAKNVQQMAGWAEDCRLLSDLKGNGRDMISEAPLQLCCSFNTNHAGQNELKNIYVFNDEKLQVTNLLSQYPVVFVY